MRTFVPSLLLLLTFYQNPLNADIIGSFTAIGDEDFNLTTIGTSDWAYWNTSVSSGYSGVPTNRRLTGNLIGDMTVVGGGTLRGSTSTTQPSHDFIFTDGVAPIDSTVDNPTGLFTTELDTVDAGVSLVVNLPTTDTYLVTLWVAAFNGTGELTASLPGMTAFQDDSLVGDGGSSKLSAYYQLTVSPNTAGDDLTLQYFLAADTGASAHVLISGAAVSVVPIPEPTSISLLCLSLIGFGTYRMRRRFKNESITMEA